MITFLFSVCFHYIMTKLHRRCSRPRKYMGMLLAYGFIPLDFLLLNHQGASPLDLKVFGLEKWI